VLTSAGDPLYVTAEEIEAQLLRAQGDLSETDMELSRSVRIGAANAFTRLLLFATGQAENGSNDVGT